MKLNVIVACALFGASAAGAQAIAPEQLMEHIRVLADDGYEGRSAGTAGGERTEAYLLEAFARAGLKPGFGGKWRQPVPVVERTSGKTAIVFSNKGGVVDLHDNPALLVGRDPKVRIDGAPVVFAGYSTAAEMADVSVKDALVLMIPANPPSTTDARSWQDRRSALIDAGAAAVVTIQPADANWKEVVAEPGTSLTPAHEAFPLARGTMSREAAQVVLDAAGGDGRRLLETAGRAEFRARRLDVTASAAIDTLVERLSPANIVGMVEGTGGRGEAVIMMGHWDHTGICAPPGAPDRICNGAIDNASGIAMLIEAARAIASGPRPQRDVYFLATTLEERGGFLGANAFAASPPDTVKRIVAVLNVDSSAVHKPGMPVAILGRGRFPALDRVIDTTARALGRKIDLDDQANVMIERQDGWAFTQRGIPSVMASGSFSDMGVLRAFLESSYHQPNDDLSKPLELGGTTEDTELHIALLRALANPDVYPAP